MTKIAWLLTLISFTLGLAVSDTTSSTNTVSRLPALALQMANNVRKFSNPHDPEITVHSNQEYEYSSLLACKNGDEEAFSACIGIEMINAGVIPEGDDTECSYWEAFFPATLTCLEKECETGCDEKAELFASNVALINAFMDCSIENPCGGETPVLTPAPTTEDEYEGVSFCLNGNDVAYQICVFQALGDDFEFDPEDCSTIQIFLDVSMQCAIDNCEATCADIEVDLQETLDGFALLGCNELVNGCANGGGGPIPTSSPVSVPATVAPSPRPTISPTGEPTISGATKTPTMISVPQPTTLTPTASPTEVPVEAGTPVEPPTASPPTPNSTDESEVENEASTEENVVEEDNFPRTVLVPIVVVFIVIGSAILIVVCRS